MECSCEIICDIDESVVVLFDKIVKSRKQHKCHECYRIIEKGEKYRSEKYVFEGKIDKHNTCLDCNSIREQFFSSFFYGDIRDMVCDFVAEVDGEIPEKCILKLTPDARDFVLELMEARWEWLDEDECD